jgi:hypothetical protein
MLLEEQLKAMEKTLTTLNPSLKGEAKPRVTQEWYLSISTDLLPDGRTGA